MVSNEGLDVHPWYVKYLCLPFAKVFFKLLLFVLLSPEIYRGTRNVPKQGGLLILSNHLSDMDPVAVTLACRRPIYFMAKAELFEMKSIAWLLRLYRVFGVKRGEPDRGAIQLAVKYLKAGHAVCVFPEGQLSEDGQLQKIMPGVQLIARMANVPVICLGLQNTNKVIPYGSLRPHFARCLVKAHWGKPAVLAPNQQEGLPQIQQEAFLDWVRTELTSLCDA